jgi:predicted phage terminase large subunit-like protein
VVKYPAFAEEDEFLDLATNDIIRTIPVTPNDPPPENCRLLRRKGEALHPARYDAQKLNRIKKTLPVRFWSALYQQNPVPDDGSYFTVDQFRRAPPPDISNSHIYIAWDFAISEGKENDYTVGTVGLQDYDDMLHVVEVVRFKSNDSFFIVNAVLAQARRWYHPSLRLGVEDGQIWRSLESYMKKRMRELKFYPAIEVLKPLTDKLVRARPLQGRMQQGMVSFNDKAEWYETVKNEMLRFPAALHDDCVDSLAWMTRVAITGEPPRKPKTKELPSWRTRLALGPAGVGHMAA